MPVLLLACTLRAGVGYSEQRTPSSTWLLDLPEYRQCPALPLYPQAAALGCEAPRELRHSFVSTTSDNGVSTEQIADLVGHCTTIVARKVYRQ